MNIHCPLTYQPQLDRLFGGDFIRELQGVPMRSFLMSADRAIRLAPLMKELLDVYTTAAWERASERPFPQTLAVLELSSFPVEIDGKRVDMPVEELFHRGVLALAPPEYRRLGQLIATYPGEETMQDRQFTKPDDLLAFTAQVFLSLYCGHLLGATFGRAAGSCLQREYLNPDGLFNDLYYLTQDGVPEAKLFQQQKGDISRALALLWQVNGADTNALESAFEEATTIYLRAKTLPSSVGKLVVDTARRIGDMAALADIYPLLTILAETLHTTFTRE